MTFSAWKDDADDIANDDNNHQKNTFELVQNIWNVALITDVNYVGSITNVDFVDTFYSGNGNSMGFRTDDFCYANLDGEADTFSYEIVNVLTL